MGIREFHSVTCQLIDVRSRDLCRTKAAKVTVPKVIGKNDDDVGRLLRNCTVRAYDHRQPRESKKEKDSNRRGYVRIYVATLPLGPLGGSSCHR